MADSDPTKALKELKKIKGHLVLYALNFLCNENLLERLGAKERMVPSKFWV